MYRQVLPEVAGACEMLGLDPLYIANEGKVVVVVAPDAAPAALQALRAHPLGLRAAQIGVVTKDKRRFVQMTTGLGGRRVVDWLSGEPLPRTLSDEFHAKFGVRISEGYGLTETAPVTNWCRPEEFRPGSVGKPLPGIDEKIVAPDGTPVPAGADGEIRIKGPNVMKGYLNRPEDTAAVFDEDGYFRTGDMGRFDADGHLSITGRIKEMLIIAGENVFPREIEAVLERHPGVHAAAVIGMQDGSRGEVPVAYVEMREGHDFDEASLRAHCREGIAQYKVPREIIRLDALPRNPTGKVVRKELVRMHAARG
jgi:long-chain acyl-CoA synthetase